MLKQVRVVYPDLDLSQIIIDDTIPPTPEGNNTVNDETDDSVHTVSQEAKDTNVEASIQPTPELKAQKLLWSHLLWTRWLQMAHLL